MKLYKTIAGQSSLPQQQHLLSCGEVVGVESDEINTAGKFLTEIVITVPGDFIG